MNSKKLRIIVDIAFIIAGIVFLIFGIRDFSNAIKTTKVTDAEKFKKSYSYVDVDNVYNYISVDNLKKNFENGNHVILLGDPTDSWTQILVRPLNSIVKEHSDKLKIEYLEVNDENRGSINDFLKSKDITMSKTPMLLFLSSGKIVSSYEKDNIFDLEYDGIPIEYWNDTKIEDLKNDLNEKLNSTFN